MNFDLSEEQVMLQDSIDNFLRRQLPPDKLLPLFDSEQGFSPSLWQGLFELGVGAILAPESNDGLGMELLDAAIVAERLGYHAMPGPFAAQLLTVYALSRCGDETQKQRWLPELMTGERIAALALDDSGAPAADTRISGKLSLVPGAPMADLLLLETHGGGLALVDCRAEGVTVETLNSVDRTRMAGSVALDNAPCQILEADAAFSARLRDGLSVLLAADAYGGALRCVEMSLEYAKTREQFGALIVNFQAVKHRLVDMAVAVELARGLYWYAAHAFDHIPDEAARMASLAKAHLGECFMRVARDAVEVHGGIGFTWEYPLQIFFKRAMFDRNYGGMPERHFERCAELGW